MVPERGSPTASKKFPAVGKLVRFTPTEAGDDIASGATSRHSDNGAANG